MKTKENLKYAAAVAAMLPGVVAGVVLLAVDAAGFASVFPRAMGFADGAFLALVAWKI